VFDGPNDVREEGKVGPEKRLRVRRIVILGAGAVTAVTIFSLSLDSTLYFHYPSGHGRPWEYPSLGVAIVEGATVLETAIAYWIFGSRTRARIWPRALVGTAVLIPWGCILGVGVIHAPIFYLVHLLWVWVMIAVAALAVLTSGAIHILEWIQAHREAEA